MSRPKLIEPTRVSGVSCIFVYVLLLSRFRRFWRRNFIRTMTCLILVGLGITGAALVGRTILRSAGPMAKRMDATLQQIGKMDFENYKYYRGGFETKMTKREAALILGVGQSSTKSRVREAHRRIMLLNHPDRGGSPYLAAKINQAKDMLDDGIRK